MALLCTGYEPFGGHETNPSGDVARALDGATLVGHDVIGEVLPVAFEDAGDRMCALLDDHDPARLSNTAGTHRCNHLLYGTLVHLDATGRDAPAGFLHPPAMPGQAARKAREGEAARGGSLTPSLPLELSERAVGIAFEVALAREE